MSKFVTREFIIPPSPSPPSSPTFPSGSRRKSENEPPPALPDSLMEALAREPPPAPQGRNAHLRHTRTPSLDQFPSPPSPSSTSFLLQSSPSALALHPSLLPDLPPLSPLGIPYPSLSRSPSVNGSLRSSPSVSPLVSKGKGRANFLSDRLNKATTFSPTSDTSPLLSDGSGLGFYSAGEDPYPTEDSPPRVPKKSLWKAVAFGRNKATARSRSPSTTPNSTRSLPPPPLEHVVRSTSTSSLDALQPSPIPAAVSTKRSDMTLRKKASSIALGLAEEGERLASHVEQAVARRASGAGRGIDQDLDDMDREERSRRSSKQLLGVDESSAVPWRGGERYVHDLVDVDDAGDDSDGEEIKDTPALSVDPAETLYSRRRQLGAEGLALLTISPTMLPLASPLEPPKSAPLLAHHTFASRANPAHLKSETLDVRSWSDGRLDLTAAGDLPGDEELLAASLGLKPNGSAATVIESESLAVPRLSTYVIAVIGPRNVGKSTVIRRGLKRPTEKPTMILQDEKENRVTTCTSQFNISGESRSVEVLEIDMAILKYDQAGVIWPVELPKCEGAMLCYDATDPRALEPLSLLLQAFWTRGSETPIIVLACKSNETLNATDTKKAAEICNVYGAGIVSLDGGVMDEGRKMKNSFNWMIRAIMNSRGEPRRPSVASTSSPNQSRRESVWPEAQSRQPSITPVPTQSLEIPVFARSTLPDVPVAFANPFDESKLAIDSVLSPPDRKDSTTSAGLESLDPAHSDPLARTPSMAAQSAPLDLHFSREDMIDKFLFASVTGNDEQYVTLFLIVYRRFARPYDVLRKLVERFDFVAGRLKTDPLLSRFAQMKLCGVLSTWFQAYPGDFTRSATFDSLQSFLEGLIPRGATWVAHYAIELIPLLKSVSRMDDPETSWALPDESLTSPPPDSFVDGERRRPSLAPSFDSSGGAPTPRIGGAEYFSPPFESNAFPGARRRESDSRTNGTTDGSNQRRRDGKEGKGSQMGLLLEYSNTLLEASEEMVAVQITRLAWDAFSEITPRDLMRHVLAPRDPKNPSSLLRDSKSNVVSSIDFVNYLADWVASMLLVQSKLKLRARLLEKFIAIAYSLREQENFDSLMGVLAGLNAQPIFRLAETMELVSLKLERDKTKMPKRLRSLNKLMAVSKSFAAYRIALANSGAHMLPYLGVHLQDITVINEVKSDMRLGLVNWSKFQQMGRSAAIVLDCARLAPQLPIDRNIESCILNVPVLDKDAQYALSYNYQPRNSTASGTTAFRKLLNTALA